MLLDWLFDFKEQYQKAKDFRAFKNAKPEQRAKILQEQADRNWAETLNTAKFWGDESQLMLYAGKLDAAWLAHCKFYQLATNKYPDIFKGIEHSIGALTKETLADRMAEIPAELERREARIFEHCAEFAER
ncbi:hypothetical protein H0067_004419 [Salmonella enterica]|nr:hypothetical protein [Salmonella enterica]